MRTGSSNAERAYHAAGGGGGGRTPVSARTPRRELGSERAVVQASGGHARDRALQDPGLKDYVRRILPRLPSLTALLGPHGGLADIWDDDLQRLGDCIGKGAFGSVYKAFNWGTGEAVAVKQIKIANLPKSELRMIEVRQQPPERPGTTHGDAADRTWRSRAGNADE